MRLRAHNAFGPPIDIEVTSCVISDDMGNPLVVAVKVGDNLHKFATVTDQDFNEFLRSMGIHKEVLVTGVTEKPLDAIQW